MPPRWLDLKLSAAIDGGDLASAWSLMERGAEPGNVRTHTGVIDVAAGSSAPIAYDVLKNLVSTLDPAEERRGRTVVLAAGSGNRRAADMVECLLDRGWAVDARDERQRTPLIAAAETQGVSSSEVVTCLLGRGAEVDARAGRGETALWFASVGETDAARLVELLLRHGADPNLADDGGTTPLMRAADSDAKCAPGIVSALVGVGAEVDVFGAEGDSALHRAARSAHRNASSIFETLAARSAKLQEWWPGLLQAAARGNSVTAPEIVSVILAKAGEAAAPTQALSCAAESPSLIQNAIASLLITAGADVNTQDEEGITPLMLASRARDESGVGMVRLLLSSGADPNLRSAAGTVALMDAASGYEEEEESSQRIALQLVRELCEAGADVRATDSENNSLLDRARGPLVITQVERMWAEATSRRQSAGANRLMREGIDRRNVGLIEQACGDGADPNRTGVNGRTALMAVAESSGEAVVSLARQLVEQGADIHAADSAGITVLMTAVGWNSALAQWLIAAGAGVRARDAMGETVLMKAVQRNHHSSVDVVKWLLDAGADSLVSSQAGKTALGLAQESDNDDATGIRNLLENHVGQA